MEVGEAAFAGFTSRAGFCLVVGGWKMQVLGAGRGCSCVVGGFCAEYC